MSGSRIVVIYNGVSSPGRSDKLDREASRLKLGIDLGTKVVLSVGRMDPIKDFSTLIRAFKSVQQVNPDSLLLIAGDGDERYLEDLRRDAGRLGITDKVVFLGTRRDIPELIAACDVFALTSISEATSMTILEAMAAERPVVATRTGGNPELVVDGKTGYLLPVGDYEAVSEALVRMLNSPEQASKLGEAGRARFEAMFTFHAMMGAYEDLYKEILLH
jgi:glycosyltransferase involved in cell wall biosynthesis